MGNAKISTKQLSRQRLDLVASPIVVTARCVVVNGYARLAAARQLGFDEMPAVLVRHPDMRRSLREEC